MMNSKNVRIHWSTHYLFAHSHLTFSAVLRDLMYGHIPLYVCQVWTAFSCWRTIFGKQIFNIKAEPHICKFLESSRERWVRIGERVICGSVYSYNLGIRHYAPNRFSALPNFWKRRILPNTVCESQFSRSLVSLCENAWECYEYSVFAYSRPFSENRRMCSSAFMLWHE